MASIKITSAKGGTGGLEGYLKQEEKTEKLLMSGKDCDISNFARDFEITRNVNSQNTGRQHYHMIQSFAPGEGTPGQVHEIGVRLAESEEFKGFQVAVVTHTDKGHLHNHIVVNAVNFETGKKYVSDAKSLYRIRDFSDKFCKEQNLSVIDNTKEKQRGKVKTYSMAKHKSMKKHFDGKEKSYVVETMKGIIETTKVATSKADFVDKMKEKGFSVKWNEELKKDGTWKIKNITFETSYINAKGEEKVGKVRLSNLRKTFSTEKLTREGLLGKFKDNLEKKQDKQESLKAKAEPRRESQRATKEPLKSFDGAKYKTAEKTLRTKIKSLEVIMKKCNTKSMDISKSENDRTILKREIRELNYERNTYCNYISELENKGVLKKVFSKKQDKKEIETYENRVSNLDYTLSKREEKLFETEKTISEKDHNNKLRNKAYDMKRGLELELKEVRIDIMKNRTDIQFIELKNSSNSKMFIAVKGDKVIASKEPNIFELKPPQQYHYKSLGEAIAMYTSKGYKPVKALDKELGKAVEKIEKSREVEKEKSYVRER